MEGEEYSSPRFAHVAGGASANFDGQRPGAEQPESSRPRLASRAFLRRGSFPCSAGKAVCGSELCTAADGALFISIDFRLIAFALQS